MSRPYYNHKQLVFGLKGTPKFTLSLAFQGDVSCTGSAEASFPLGESGLTLKIGPELVFKASGEVGASFTWEPTIDVGFTLTSHGFTKRTLAFANGSGIDFTGSGTASLQLDLAATVETDGAVAGLEGEAGPTITAKVTEDTATRETCWSGELTADADFSAFVDVFGFINENLNTGELQMGKAEQLAGGCVTPSAPTIVFDGSPGTGAPPATLGPYTMTAFAPDPTAEGTVESEITGPTGPIDFGTPLSHELVGSGWQTWSNGYTGDVYEDETELPDGDFQVTVTLPPGTGAFYAYAEPNEFQDFDMSATAAGGPSSGDITVYGDSGAQYFGFYATCGHALTSVTYTDSGGDTAMAIGEFGIARTC